MYLIILLLNLTFFPGQYAVPMSPPVMAPQTDTLPPIITEEFIREFTALPQQKTWRDSGYYFQLELVDWINRGFRTTNTGDYLLRSTVISASSSGTQFRARAILRIDKDDWPMDNFPSPNTVEWGSAILAFPQDLLFCPSGNEEIGLGQNELYMPLSVGGEITRVFNDTILFTSIPLNAQIRSFDVIME
ncbi:hypothetical protein [Lewinella sp. W8]|uniref:hypothetical protein n=1 Tax=Lewinella sp. W8 TaxID=2528208 RepID=UPI001068BD73|nr:hypothetical protein [Lewinella sp. W8]MTB49397.1 hypothetical protein [Lewinella sp. W8]